MKSILMMPMLLVFLWAGQYDKVKITSTLSYVYVYHKGKAVKIHRIQDTSNKLTGEYVKQYRPYTNIQPMHLMQGIQTIGEVELLEFMKEKGNTKKGMVIDVRLKSDYQSETIPSSVNIPLDITINRIKMHKILKFFGVTKLKNGILNTDDVLSLVLYGHGIWSNEARMFIEKLLELGYPSDKILYYRGGIQMWKILGFTTVTH